MMTRKRFGLTVLAVGIVVLLIGLYFLFNTDSGWRWFFMPVSIFINGFGIAVLSVKD